MSENGTSKRSPVVVVGVDGSAGSSEAVRWAVAEARLRKVPLRAVHSWIYLHPLVPLLVGYPFTRDSIEPAATDAAAVAEQAAETIVEQAMAELGEVDDVEVERVIVQGSAAQVLIDSVSEQDLLVVGCGHGGLAGLLSGSVSQHCALHASCPVVIVRAGVERT